VSILWYSQHVAPLIGGTLYDLILALLFCPQASPRARDSRRLCQATHIELGDPRKILPFAGKALVLTDAAEGFR